MHVWEMVGCLRKTKILFTDPITLHLCPFSTIYWLIHSTFSGSGWTPIVLADSFDYSTILIKIYYKLVCKKINKSKWCTFIVVEGIGFHYFCHNSLIIEINSPSSLKKVAMCGIFVSGSSGITFIYVEYSSKSTESEKI